MISREKKIMALSGTIPMDKDIEDDILEDQKLFPGLRQQILKRIDCKRCGWCCKHNKVHIKLSEIQRIRKYLRMTKEDFMNKYVEKNPGGYYFHLPCPFLVLGQDGKYGCTVYPVRAEVCRNFPVDTMTMTIGECHVSKEILDIIEKCAGVKNVSADTDTVLSKLHQDIAEELNVEYDESSADCKYALIDRFTLKTVLGYLKKRAEDFA